MPNEDMITAKEKAAELNISRSTLSRKVKLGIIVPAWRDEETHNGVMLFTRGPVKS